MLGLFVLETIAFNALKPAKPCVGGLSQVLYIRKVLILGKKS